MTTIIQGQSSAPRLRRLSTLIGYYPELEAIRHLLNEQFIDLPSTLTELHALWERTASNCEQLPKRNAQYLSLSTPRELEQNERQLIAVPALKRAYQNVEFHLLKIPVQQLVTAQWYLDLDYCEKLTCMAPRPESADWQDVLDFLYGNSQPWGKPGYDRSSSDRALLFPGIVSNIDARFTRIESRAEEPNTFDVNLQLRPGYNCLHVAVFQRSRLVIINGVHHACALLQAGWNYIPCLVRKAQHSLSEIGFPAGQPGVLPEEYVLQGRPAYLSNYFDNTIAPVFRQYVVDRCALHLQACPLVSLGMVQRERRVK